MAFPLAAALGIGTAASSVLGGLFASNAQGDATDAATAAAMARLNFEEGVWEDQLALIEDALDLQKGEFRDLKQALAPYRTAGENALAAYNYEVMGGDKPTLTNYEAQQERRDILQGDKGFQRLKDSNVFAVGDGQFGYGRGPNYDRIEKGKRTTTSPGTPPNYANSGDGNFSVGYSGGVDPRTGMSSGTAPVDTTENVFTVGKREFDTRREAKDFMDRRAARGYDGETFDTRREANRALGDATGEARRGALDDAGFERGSVKSEYEGYSRSPEARLRIQEGRRAIQGSAAASGGLLSGDTINALAKDRDKVVTTDRNNYLNRLWGLSETGLDTIGMTGSSNPLAGAALGSATLGSSNIGSSMMDLGSIQAQGAAAQGNIFQNVLSQLGEIGGYFGGGSGGGITSPYLNYSTSDLASMYGSYGAGRVGS